MNVITLVVSAIEGEEEVIESLLVDNVLSDDLGGDLQ